MGKVVLALSLVLVSTFAFAEKGEREREKMRNESNYNFMRWQKVIGELKDHHDMTGKQKSAVEGLAKEVAAINNTDDLELRAKRWAELNGKYEALLATGKIPGSNEEVKLSNTTRAVLKQIDPGTDKFTLTAEQGERIDRILESQRGYTGESVSWGRYNVRDVLAQHMMNVASRKNGSKALDQLLATYEAIIFKPTAIVDAAKATGRPGKHAPTGQVVTTARPTAVFNLGKDKEVTQAIAVAGVVNPELIPRLMRLAEEHASGITDPSKLTLNRAFRNMMRYLDQEIKKVDSKGKSEKEVLEIAMKNLQERLINREKKFTLKQRDEFCQKCADEAAALFGVCPTKVAGSGLGA